MKPDVKKVLKNTIKPINEKFAILLSSGIDSRSIFFESIEQKKDFECYTFRLENVFSTDFLEAKSLCEQYGIKHNEIILPDSIEVLKKDLIILKDLGAKKKTDFECFWPFLYIYKAVKESVIISGLAADGHFCISKKGMIHFKDKPDVFRKITFGNPGYCQAVLHINYNEGKKHLTPYLSQEMINEFKGTSWDQINKPKQKNSIIEPYKSYLENIKLYKHQSYQLGDSGISDHFKKLLKTELNTNNFKSVVSIYNRIGSTQKTLF